MRPEAKASGYLGRGLLFWCGFLGLGFAGVEEEREGEGEDGGEDGEESPGELEEGEVGEVVPDGRGDGEE